MPWAGPALLCQPFTRHPLPSRGRIVRSLCRGRNRSPGATLPTKLNESGLQGQGPGVQLARSWDKEPPGRGHPGGAPASTPDSAVGSGKDPSALGSDPPSSMPLSFLIHNEGMIASSLSEDKDEGLGCNREVTHRLTANTYRRQPGDCRAGLRVAWFMTPAFFICPGTLRGSSYCYPT